MHSIKRTVPTFVTQPRKKGKNTVSLLNISARNRSPSPRVEKVEVRSRCRRTKAKSRRGVTAIRDDEMWRILAIETNEECTGEDQRIRSAVRPAAILQRAAGLIIGIAVGPEGADERRTADTRKE